MTKLTLLNLNFRRRAYRASLHRQMDNGGIRTRPWFNASRTAVGRDEDSDAEDVYGAKADVFRVHRTEFPPSIRRDIISKYIFLIAIAQSTLYYS